MCRRMGAGRAVWRSCGRHSQITWTACMHAKTWLSMTPPSNLPSLPRYATPPTWQRPSQCVQRAPLYAWAKPWRDRASKTFFAVSVRHSALPSECHWLSRQPELHRFLSAQLERQLRLANARYKELQHEVSCMKVQMAGPGQERSKGEDGHRTEPVTSAADVTPEECSVPVPQPAQDRSLAALHPPNSLWNRTPLWLEIDPFKRSALGRSAQVEDRDAACLWLNLQHLDNTSGSLDYICGYGGGDLAQILHLWAR